MNILITSAQHFASFQLANLLNQETILFGDQFQDFPQANSLSLAHELLKFCLDHQIEQVYPLRSDELDALAESKVLFDEFGIQIVLSSKQDLVLFDAKQDLADSFAQLSSKILSLGYPTQKIAIADLQHHGNLILIDDTNKNFDQVFTKIHSVSFTQLGKLFNQNPFRALALYQVTDDLQKVFVLINDGEITYSLKPSQQLLENIEKAFSNLLPNGFYQVDYAGEQILKIKNAAL